MHLLVCHVYRYVVAMLFKDPGALFKKPAVTCPEGEQGVEDFVGDDVRRDVVPRRVTDEGRFM